MIPWDTTNKPALRLACPSSGSKGSPVSAVTIRSLVKDESRARAARLDGFRFCPDPSCDVAYFRPETGDRFLKEDVLVRIGQKETSPPRPICYCFDHSVEEFEAEVARTGSSRVPDEIGVNNISVFYRNRIYLKWYGDFVEVVHQEWFFKVLGPGLIFVPEVI